MKHHFSQIQSPVGHFMVKLAKIRLQTCSVTFFAKMFNQGIFTFYAQGQKVSFC
jgi:hypothetical protein